MGEPQRIATVAGQPFVPSLFVRCDMCERVCSIASPWFHWWLVGPRVSSSFRRKSDNPRGPNTSHIVRCPTHVNAYAARVAGFPRQSKAFHRWMHEGKTQHADDDVLPPGTPLVFPTAEEWDLFTRAAWDDDFTDVERYRKEMVAMDERARRKKARRRARKVERMFVEADL